jgi:hypothetical protein
VLARAFKAHDLLTYASAISFQILTAVVPFTLFAPRAREDLVKTRVAVSNQLRAELERLWPGPVGLFMDLDSRISLAFLESYPSPVEAKTLGDKRLAAFLARQGYPGRQKPAELLAKLRSAPGGRAGEQEVKARRRIVLGLVQTLRTLAGELNTLEREIAAACASIPTAPSFCRCSRSPIA